jgi:hypothetical protein
MFSTLFQRYRVAIQKVITAEDEAISAVISALHNLPLILRAVPFAAETAEKTQKINEEDAQEIISVVVLLTALSEDNNFPTIEAINLISKFIEEDEFFSDISKEKLLQTRKRLIGLVDNASTLRVVYKASKVFDDYERIFDNAKIITDIRPVFSSGVDTENTDSEVLRAVTITHSMKIEYRDSEGEKEFFVALDSIQLENLYEKIVDALDRNEAVKSMLKTAKITYIDSDVVPDSEV